MTGWHVLLLVVAGFAAGMSGTITGLASLFSYPALLYVGLPPLIANVTNTVALLGSSVGSVAGSRPELRGQGDRIRRLGPVAVLGGAAGGVLLLATPSGSFVKIVPWLIALGSVAILAGPRQLADDAAPAAKSSVGVIAGMFLIAVYGGYFGAAAGVLLLAMLLISTRQSLPRCNAVKNVLLGLANAVAAVIFVVHGSIDWAAAAPLAAGLLVGGWIGPIVVRHASARLLRVIIAVAGLGLAVYLAVDAY